MSIAPIGPVVLNPECSSIPFGAEGGNHFEVALGSDLVSGSTVEFLSWGSIISDSRECVGPWIEFAITLD